MGQTSRYLVLLFFALMQCIAPIAHAHADGHSVGHGVHLDLDTPDLSDPGVVHASSVTAVHSHASIISMPPGHSSDKYSFPIPVQHATALLPSNIAVTQIAILDSTSLIYQHHAYERPFGQAPPL